VSTLRSPKSGRIILCTVYDRRSTLGLVRYRAVRASRRLEPVFRDLFEKVGMGEPMSGAPGYADAAGREVDALFGE